MKKKSTVPDLIILPVLRQKFFFPVPDNSTRKSLDLKAGRYLKPWGFPTMKFQGQRYIYQLIKVLIRYFWKQLAFARFAAESFPDCKLMFHKYNLAVKQIFVVCTLF